MPRYGWGQKMPASWSEFFIIVLETAATTSRMFEVSIAWVTLYDTIDVDEILGICNL